MDTSWWLALGAVVALALVATLVDGRGRSRRRPGRSRRGAGGRTRPPGRPAGAGRAAGRSPKAARAPKALRTSGAPKELKAPRAAEIWWAEVPYEDVPGAKDRPCLVLRVRGDAVTVAKITSKYHDERAGVIPLPPGTVSDAQGRPSFLETDELREVGVWAFRRRVGVVDPALWDQVRHLAG
ncbi:type II toxin-antitoxin system PemK/MazF family toxin [Streptomyces sp. NPDC048361]|uniref:type II toxin-antitoxin system PemK/MazF family toxin n=1 Tax=Streptomyces sp. NPDC048361 TaxID=3154720 RepID=UPI003421233A